MIDTHCHLTDPRLFDQIDGVLARAARVGVKRIITIGCEPTDDRAAVAVAERFPAVYASVGLHPCYLPNGSNRKTNPMPSFDQLSALLRELCANPRVVAIGEIGLDKHWDKADATIALQRRYFEFQLQLAIGLNKPVVLHTREAIDEALAILANFPGTRAVFHSFTGTPAEARRITDRGFLIGFTGPVTYKKNDELRIAARDCPIDQLVVETDGPYLSPEPVRNQRVNEPAFVLHTAWQIAQLKGMTLEAFDAATTRNAERLFGF